MSSHFIHMNLKKNREKNVAKKIGTNNTTEDKTKSKSSIIANNTKKQSSKIIFSLKEIKCFVFKNFSKKYNTLPDQYSLIQIDNFISGKYCHSLASFKEKLIFNYDEEFLKKYYKIKETSKKIPLFYEFYKSYLKFFCIPIFSNLPLNELLDKVVEKKAKVFYDENYKDEPKKVEKKLNFVIFTSKIRKDLSRATNLTNLSKTTIKEGNLTNKSSIISYNSLAKIFNEIDFKEKPNRVINNNVIQNKSFNRKDNLNDYKNEKIKKKKNVLKIKVKDGNSVKNNIKNNINEKDNSNIFKNNNLTTINNNLSHILYNNNNSSNQNNYFITDTNSNYKCKKIPIKKKKTQIIKININEKNDNIPTLLQVENLNNNKSQRQNNKSPFNNIINNNKNNSSNILIINTGNNTIKNDVHYNEKIIKKINSRNYQNNFLNDKNTFSKLSANTLYKMSSLRNKIPNINYLNSLNSINTESINKLTPKNIIRIKKIDNNKKIINNKSIEKKDSYNKKIFKNNNNIIKIKIKGEESGKNSIKNKNNNSKKYQKISPYKKPNSVYVNKNNLNNKNNNIEKKLSDKIKNNINSVIQPKHKYSYVKTSWNKKDKNIFYKIQKLDSNQYKKGNKSKSKSKSKSKNKNKK